MGAEKNIESTLIKDNNDDISIQEVQGEIPTKNCFGYGCQENDNVEEEKRTFGILLKMKSMKQSYMTMEYFYKLVETYIVKKLWSNLMN